MAQDFCTVPHTKAAAAVILQASHQDWRNPHLPASLPGQPFCLPASISASVFNILLHNYTDSVKLASEEKWHWTYKDLVVRSVLLVVLFASQTKAPMFSWCGWGTCVFICYHPTFLTNPPQNFGVHEETTTCSRSRQDCESWWWRVDGPSGDLGLSLRQISVWTMGNSACYFCPTIEEERWDIMREMGRETWK